MDNQFDPNSYTHLRQVLDTIFPHAYIESRHRHPSSICSLFSVKCRSVETSSKRNALAPISGQSSDCETKQRFDHIHEASAEPASRSSLINFREQFEWSLKKHQAKLVGLCPVRRAIYDQCFDELIRQVTVSCVDQGLLLFRVRNELRMTIDYYRRAYESGVRFGLNKAIMAERLVEQSRAQLEEQEKSDPMSVCVGLNERITETELKNRLDSMARMKQHYDAKLALKDEVIERQRAIIRALSNNRSAVNG